MAANGCSWWVGVGLVDTPLATRCPSQLHSSCTPEHLSSVPLPLLTLQGSTRDWIVRKKKQQRSRGYTNIKPDSRYTGRKRKDRF